MKDNSLLPLATSTWNELEEKALKTVMDSGRFTMGKHVRQFEEEFADFVGAKHALMVNSGSSANLLAVASLILDQEVNLNPGDEVLVPAVSWATTYFPLQQYGLKLVFVDVDLDTLNIDLNVIENAITTKTRAIFAVNLLGNPVNFDRLRTICDDNDLLLIEDNCESLGATYGGKQAGTFGTFGTFSTFFSHHISTMEGGLLVTDNEKLHQISKSLRAHGWTRELESENLLSNKIGNSFDDSFRFILPGYNLRPLEMSGAVGLEQLKKIPEIVEGRRKNASNFQELFSGLQSVLIQKETGQSSWFGFSIVLTGKLSGLRNEVLGMLDNIGVETRPIVGGNFTRNPVMSHLNARIFGKLDNADTIHDNGLFVGNHHFDITEALEKIYDSFAKID